MKTGQSLGNRLAYYALLVLEKPFGLMPTSWMWRFGATLGWFTYRFAKKRRAIVMENLKTVYPEHTAEQIDGLTKEVFRYSSANLVSSVNTGFISSRTIPSIVEVKGQENIRNLDPSKGCILLAFHMGNWELLSRISPLLDTEKPLGAIFRPLNNPLISEHVTQNRMKDGLRLFSRKPGLIKANKFLREGGLLTILGDQHAGGSGVTLPLFGKETSISPLASILAQRNKCPIMPVVLTTLAPGKWIVDYQTPIFIDENLDKEQATAQIVPILERVMRDNCKDIFWLHDRWKVKGNL